MKVARQDKHDAAPPVEGGDLRRRVWQPRPVGKKFLEHGTRRLIKKRISGRFRDAPRRRRIVGQGAEANVCNLHGRRHVDRIGDAEA